MQNCIWNCMPNFGPLRLRPALVNSVPVRRRQLVLCGSGPVHLAALRPLANRVPDDVDLLLIAPRRHVPLVHVLDAAVAAATPEDRPDALAWLGAEADDMAGASHGAGAAQREDAPRRAGGDHESWGRSGVVDLAGLCARLGVRFVQDTPIDIRFDEGQIVTRSGQRIGWSHLSIDVEPVHELGRIERRGPVTVIGFEPASDFLDSFQLWHRAARSIGKPRSVAIVGANPAAVGMGFAFAALMRDDPRLSGSRVMLVAPRGAMHAGDMGAMSGDAAAALRMHDVRRVQGTYRGVLDGRLLLDPDDGVATQGGPGTQADTLSSLDSAIAAERQSRTRGLDSLMRSELPQRPHGKRGPRVDLVVVTHDAQVPPWFTAAMYRQQIRMDGRGAMAVSSGLRALDRDEVFAAGACASVLGLDLSLGMQPARAQARVLVSNLVQSLKAKGGDTRKPDRLTLRPRGRVLVLVDRHDGEAMLGWGRSHASGRWVRHLKLQLDRRRARAVTGSGR